MTKLLKATDRRKNPTTAVITHVCLILNVFLGLGLDISLSRSFFFSPPLSRQVISNAEQVPLELEASGECSDLTVTALVESQRVRLSRVYYYMLCNCVWLLARTRNPALSKTLRPSPTNAAINKLRTSSRPISAS